MVVMTYISTLTSCDNTPTVSWVTKRQCPVSTVATELLKIWGARMTYGDIPPPMIHFLAGKTNVLADQ